MNARRECVLQLARFLVNHLFHSLFLISFEAYRIYDDAGRQSIGTYLGLPRFLRTSHREKILIVWSVGCSRRMILQHEVLAPRTHARKCTDKCGTVLAAFPP